MATLQSCELRYLPIKVGDTAGVLEYRVLNGLQPQDVTGSTVSFRVVNPATATTVETVIIDDSGGFVVDGPDGKVGYQRILADVVLAFPDAVAQWTINFVSGDIHVSPDIALPILADI